MMSGLLCQGPSPPLRGSCPVNYCITPPTSLPVAGQLAGPIFSLTDCPVRLTANRMKVFPLYTHACTHTHAHRHTLTNFKDSSADTPTSRRSLLGHSLRCLSQAQIQPFCSVSQPLSYKHPVAAPSRPTGLSVCVEAAGVSRESGPEEKEGTSAVAHQAPGGTRGDSPPVSVSEWPLHALCQRHRTVLFS